MKNKINSGERLTLTAPAGGVVSGGGYQIGQLFVVAVADAAQGDPFVGEIYGTYSLPKTSAQAWTEGQLIYWDGTECTTTSLNNLLIGCAAAAAANPSATGEVRLSGSPQIDSAS